MTINAKIIADSVANGVRLTTLELEYPRFIHSQMMTHRMFSRNASSSRAIPTNKTIEAVLNNPAIPISWGVNKAGMQADEEFSDLQSTVAQHHWNQARQATISCVKPMTKIGNVGVHKQIINRLLEPFQHIKVIVTATEWDNFFKLRLHEDSQPEIQELARVMKQAMDESKPWELDPGDYHLPYVDVYDHMYTVNDEECIDYPEAIKCSVARCARVSYNNHDNSTPDIEKDIKLADKLLAAGHMSCFEHQATPMKPLVENVRLEDGITHVKIRSKKSDTYWSNNFRGWIQYRALL